MLWICALVMLRKGLATPTAAVIRKIAIKMFSAFGTRTTMTIAQRAILITGISPNTQHASMKLFLWRRILWMAWILSSGQINRINLLVSSWLCQAPFLSIKFKFKLRILWRIRPFLNRAILTSWYSKRPSILESTMIILLTISVATNWWIRPSWRIFYLDLSLRVLL